MNMKARVRKLARKGIAFYRRMLENQLDLIINISGDGTVLFVNQACCDFYGRKAEEMEGRKITELNVLTIEAKQIAQLISIITPEKPVKFYRNSFMKNGIESVWMEWTGRGSFNDRNELLSIQSVGHDISELIKTQSRLKESHENFMRLAHTAPALIYISIPEIDRLAWVNARYEEFTGYSTKECLAIRSWDIIHPDYRESLKADSLEILKDKTSSSQQEIKIITKDGRELWEDLSKSHIEWEGQDAILGVAYDITEQKQAQELILQKNIELQAGYSELEAMNEEIQASQESLIALNKQLQQSQERLELAVWGSNEGLWDCDIVTGYLTINDRYAEMLGYDPKEFINHISTLKKLIHPFDEILVRTILIKHLKGEIPFYEVEYRLKTRAGNWIWVFDRGKVVEWDENKRAIRIVGMRTDITVQKQAEEQIRYLSFNDSLTGLYNRAFIKEELLRLDTPRQFPLSVIMGDVNALKLTNDAFGHFEGDKLLIRIADILREACRKKDVIARWGGDEFLILLPQTNQKDAYTICRRIHDFCRNAPADPIHPSIALGAASKVREDQKLQDIIAEAEDSMYRNKLLEGNSLRNSIISSLEQSLHERTHETREHARRMQDISVAFARVLDLPFNEVERLILLAKLHDIGKIGIPDHLLIKPAELTQEEWDILRKHPEIGFRITQSSHDLMSISQEVLSHHERWDGTGYPRRLLGEEIPYLARIINIVDSYDVMTEGRPYQEPKSPAEAIIEIRNCAGTQFDPSLVEIFCQVFDKSQQ